MEPDCSKNQNYIKNSSVYTHTKESSLLYTDGLLWLQVNGKPVNVKSIWGVGGDRASERAERIRIAALRCLPTGIPHRHNFASYMVGCWTTSESLKLSEFCNCVAFEEAANGCASVGPAVCVSSTEHWLGWPSVWPGHGQKEGRSVTVREKSTACLPAQPPGFLRLIMTVPCVEAIGKRRSRRRRQLDIFVVVTHIGSFE